MKRMSLAALAVATALSSTAFAETPAATGPWAGKWAGTIGAYTNYVFRGVTQTKDAPAVQGNVDYLFNNGLKFGVWGSNVDFSGATSEFDFYGAYTMVSGGLSAEAGVVYYAYPGQDNDTDLNYVEPYISVGYDFGPLALTGSFNYSPDYTGGTGDATYTRLTAKIPLPHDITLDGWIGYQTIEKNTIAALPDYWDWAVGAAYAYDAFTFKVQYTDTDIAQNQCSNSDNCDDKYIASVTRSF